MGRRFRSETPPLLCAPSIAACFETRLRGPALNQRFTPRFQHQTAMGKSPAVSRLRMSPAGGRATPCRLGAVDAPARQGKALRPVLGRRAPGGNSRSTWDIPRRELHQHPSPAATSSVVPMRPMGCDPARNLHRHRRVPGRPGRRPGADRPHAQGARRGPHDAAPDRGGPARRGGSLLPPRDARPRPGHRNLPEPRIGRAPARARRRHQARPRRGGVRQPRGMARGSTRGRASRLRPDLIITGDVP